MGERSVSPSNHISFRLDKVDFPPSIFDMNFVLPPLVEMTEVEKEMPAATAGDASCLLLAGYCTVLLC
jgi:hypothetical protein